MRSSGPTDAQLAQIAQLYYERGLTLHEIGLRLGVSYMTVSRMLAKARERGMVQITIRTPFERVQETEARLTEAYGLKDAFVVKQTPGESVRELLARAGAYYLEQHLYPGQVLGLAVGTTVADIVQNLSNYQFKELTVVQLLGALENVEVFNSHDILQTACRKLGAKGIYFHAPVVALSAEARALLEEQIPTRLREAWAQCDVAITGVGPLTEASLWVRAGLVTLEEIKELTSLGAAGDVLARFYDFSGRFLDTDWNRRVMSIPLETFARIDKMIVVSGGSDRLGPIYGALRSGLVKALVTDHGTASQLLSGDWKSAFPPAGAPGKRRSSAGRRAAAGAS